MLERFEYRLKNMFNNCYVIKYELVCCYQGTDVKLIKDTPDEFIGGL